MFLIASASVFRHRNHASFASALRSDVAQLFFSSGTAAKLPMLPSVVQTFCGVSADSRSGLLASNTAMYLSGWGKTRGHWTRLRAVEIRRPQSVLSDTAGESVWGEAPREVWVLRAWWMANYSRRLGVCDALKTVNLHVTQISQCYCTVSSRCLGRTQAPLGVKTNRK